RRTAGTAARPGATVAPWNTPFLFTRILLSLLRGCNLRDALPNPVLLHLAAGGARIVADLVQLLRPLLAGHPGPFEVVPHLVQRGHGVAGFDPYHGGGAFAEARIGRGDHDGLGDGGHAEQHLLHLQRADVLAAADDQVGLAVGDGQVAVVVEHTDVAGVVPAVVIEGPGGQRVVGVTQAEVRSAGEDLTVLGDADLHAGARIAVGVEPFLLRRSRPRAGDR